MEVRLFSYYPPVGVRPVEKGLGSLRLKLLLVNPVRAIQRANNDIHPFKMSARKFLFPKTLGKLSSLFLREGASLELSVSLVVNVHFQQARQMVCWKPVLYPGQCIYFGVLGVESAS